jgi:TRAP-type C4-dicarboxylate transport system permease large subunit
MLPAMLEIGYPRRFAAGIIVIGGALGNLIPPSIIMVLYAVATSGAVYFGPEGQKVSSASVGQLFIAGVVPGMILAAMLSGLYIVTNAVLFSFLMTSEQIRRRWRTGSPTASLDHILLLGVLLLLAGNVMEPPITLSWRRILYLIAVKLGINPVHFIIWW